MSPPSNALELGQQLRSEDRVKLLAVDDELDVAEQRHRRIVVAIRVRDLLSDIAHLARPLWTEAIADRDQ